eukprot:SAG22_NODE_19478_length_274_cov_1.131429_1_plen_86_part_10
MDCAHAAPCMAGTCGKPPWARAAGRRLWARAAHVAAASAPEHMHAARSSVALLLAAAVPPAAPASALTAHDRWIAGSPIGAQPALA